MTEFKDSDWMDGGFVEEYLDAVDLKIPQRQRMFELAVSYYRHFLGDGTENVILDLGCGNGILTRKLMEVDGTIHAVLVDASLDMLQTARKTLAPHDKIQYVHTSFEEMIESGFDMGPFDMTVSSLAIHHLALEDKKELFGLIFRNLRPGGHFLNIDTMLPPTPSLEGWYLALWEDWMRRRCDDVRFAEGMALMNGHHQVEAHHACLDTLTDQLNILKEVGFEGVDVIFKDGIFTIYCGWRP